MKLILIPFLAICFASTVFGCEYHRRLTELRRISGPAARQEEREIIAMGPKVYNEKVRLSKLRAGGSAGSSHVLDDHDHHDHSDSHTEYRRPTAVGGSYSIASLPDDHHFCDGSSEYYCHDDANCVMDDDGSYKCVYERKVNLNGVVSQRRYPTYSRTPVRSGSYGRAYYPIRDQTYRTSGRTYPTSSRYSSSRRYPYRSSSSSSGRYIYRPRKCSVGEKQINITSTYWKCVDIDECTAAEKPCQHNCRNTHGSFYCTCRYGYERVGRYNCTDKDECENEKACPYDCLNTEGSYQCLCPQGYHKYGRRCIEINECEQSHVCEDDELCFNLWGSYECSPPESCPDGYVRRQTDKRGSCILQEGSPSEARPSVISFRKIAVKAKDTPDSRNSLASMTFSGGLSNRYIHNYNIRVLRNESSDKIWHRRQHSWNSQVLTIDLYNREPLEANVRIQYVVLITDTPTRNSRYYQRYSYRNYYLPQPLPETRKVVVTLVPMAHGGGNN